MALTLCAILLFAAEAPSPPAASAQPAQASPLILAVHPYLPPFEIKNRFQPLAEYLSERLQHKVVVKVSSDYPEHITAVGMDLADIAFLGPAPYVHMVQKYGLKPLLARLENNGSPTLVGNIVVRKESPLKSLNELKGHRFAFVSRESTLGFLIPQQMLGKEKVSLEDLASYDFLNSHQNVALAVNMGDFDAGAVQHDVYLAKQDHLRSIAQSPPISEHLFVASTKLSPAMVEKARAALLAIGKDKHGSEILHSIKGEITNLAPVRDEDYDHLRSILGMPQTKLPQ